MTTFPCLVRSPAAKGESRFALGHPMVDRYLDFVAGRSRPNTLRAVAFDLKAFFTVIGKDPLEVTPVDVFDFLAHQRGDRRVVRLSDGESGLSARTIARRLSSVSGFYAYVVARGDTAVAANPVPRGLATRRAGGTKRSRRVPLVRLPRSLPKILSPAEVDQLLAALRTQRDKAMVLAMLLGGLRRCEVLGLRLEDLWVGERRLFVVDGKGGHQRVVPIADRFFAVVGDYLHDERPKASTRQVFVVLKGPRRGQPLSSEGLDEILAGARRRAGLERGTCHQLRHTCLTRLREAGMALDAVQAQAGHRSIESTRIYLHLTNDWLCRRVPPGVGAHRRLQRRRGRDERRPGGVGMTGAVPAPRLARGSKAAQEWATIAARAPQMADTMARFLAQAATFLAPSTIDATGAALRRLARWLLDTTDVRAVAELDRTTMEDYKLWLAAQPGQHGEGLSINSRRQRLQILRMFFERIIEWEWDDAPLRNPLMAGDIPTACDPLPKFLDDDQAARLMAAARASVDPRERLVVELLARTGMRASEACGLEADAVVRIGDGHWLRVPLGKLRNDRYVPLHPQLVELLSTGCADNLDAIRRHRRLIADHRGPIDRHGLGRIVRRVGRRAGVVVHPHQLRHTLATQAINRGMRLEAIAALLGHRSMHMTLTYAPPTGWWPRSTGPSPPRWTPSMASPWSCPPTSRASAWRSFAGRPTPGCSATGCAPDPSSSTAGWRARVKPAATSPPPWSSARPWCASATTLETTSRRSAPPSSTGS